MHHLTIQYSYTLLTDFDALVKDFIALMTFNLIHADKDLPPACAAKVRELISFSLASSRELLTLFEHPLAKHEAKNKERLMKNITRLNAFFHDYLHYSGSVLSRCRNDIYHGRYHQVLTHYRRFHDTHLSGKR